MSQDPLATQVGGAHYKGFAIQPTHFIWANRLGFIEGSVVKYVCRHAQKNGAEDLRKAIHYLEILIALQYPEANRCNRKRIASRKV